MKNIKRKRLIWIISAVLLVAALLITLLVLYLRPIKEIRITNEDVKYNETVGKYKTVYLDGDGTAFYKIEYEVSPSFLKSSDVSFEYKERDGVRVSDDGVVRFTAETYVKIKIVPKNGNGDAEDNIMIIAKKK